MSRTKKAAVGSLFAYSQYTIALLSGFVVFPLTIRHVGAYDNGLWLMTGELVGYLLLGDLGIFAILPWVVAAKDGAGDRSGIGRFLADALALGCGLSLVFVAFGVGVWYATPQLTGLAGMEAEKIRGPLVLLLLLTGVGFPLRAFQALLAGLQDVMFTGPCSLAQASGTVGLTALLILLGFGLPGLAIAAGLPPLLVGVAAAIRTFARYPETTVGWLRPSWAGCGQLVRQGLGAWFGSFGVRLLTSSNSLVFAALGRPDWATEYAATGKLAQVGQAACWVIPDSGLVGLSQVCGENQVVRSRRTVLCLSLLYLLIPGAAAIFLLVFNPWFVNAWLGPTFYAGDDVNAFIAFNLVAASVAGGLFKVVGVVGYRMAIGLACILSGCIAVPLGYGLGLAFGQVGIGAAALFTSLGVMVPVGLYMVGRVFGIKPGEFVSTILAPWGLRAMALMVFATWLGGQIAGSGLLIVAATSMTILALHFLALRTLLGRFAWPAAVQVWLLRFHLVGQKSPEA